MILEIWGDPWISPGMSECCYFVGFSWYSEMSCFFMLFHRNLKVMMFCRKMKNYMVFTLILGGLNVAISLVLGMFSEFHMFSQVRFLQISLNISMEQTCASVETRSSKHVKS